MTEQSSTNEERLERLKEVGSHIAEQADLLKEVADELRSDVNDLTDRVAVVEDDAVHAASKLVEARDTVRVEQHVQDDRLDTLEDGNGSGTS